MMLKFHMWTKGQNRQFKDTFCPPPTCSAAVFYSYRTTKRHSICFLHSLESEVFHSLNALFISAGDSHPQFKRFRRRMQHFLSLRGEKHLQHLLSDATRVQLLVLTTQECEGASLNGLFPSVLLKNLCGFPATRDAPFTGWAHVIFSVQTQPAPWTICCDGPLRRLNSRGEVVLHVCSCTAASLSLMSIYCFLLLSICRLI